nr:puromycin transacetylase [Integrative vector pWLG11]AAF01144.1 puromycin transacetylase [Integrative expression vector pWLG13]AAF01146.1 puromycin transacetylase [Integrative expression vector pWLG14]AAF01148.1 puromycin transacetylase [Expression shuttle vector pWLG30]
MTEYKPTVRLATRDDVPRAVRTLAAAFADYPATRHTVDPDRHIERVTRAARTLPHARRARHRQGVGRATRRRGGGLDHAGERRSGGGVRRDRNAHGRVERFPAGRAATDGRPPGAAPAQGARVVPGHRRRLARPPGQGSGQRRRAPRSGGGRARRGARLPGDLRAPQPPFYERLGFTVTADVECPKDRATWCMTRKPGA